MVLASCLRLSLVQRSRAALLANTTTLRQALAPKVGAPGCRRPRPRRQPITVAARGPVFTP